MKNELADSLRRVKEAANTYGGSIVRSTDISRKDRELLTTKNWLQPIIKGWYLFATPNLQGGESTFWYATIWEFLSVYLSERYGKNYCLSAEHSIDIHIGSPTVPKQIIVIIKEGGSFTLDFPFDTSLLVYQDPNFSDHEVTTLKGLNIMELSYALCKASPAYYLSSPEESTLALQLVRSPEDIAYQIVKHNFHRPASRILGAYQALGEHEKAEKIQKFLSQAGVKIKGENPFEITLPTPLMQSPSPHAGRIEFMWKSYRQTIVDVFEDFETQTLSLEEVLSFADEIYQKDAYHSLSIEGFVVDPQLIENVQSGDWSPDKFDKEKVNALAAKGYYEAFRAVKNSIKQLYTPINSGVILEDDLQTWYGKLFSPLVDATLLKPADIIGFRRHPVYIRNSRHLPPPFHSVPDAMQTLFNCLKNEPHAAVRAVLGHFLLGFIHPYMDGNGRLARFVMNFMFISGGFPWTVIEVQRRSEYLSALEEASVNKNIEPFAQFILDEMQ